MLHVATTITPPHEQLEHHGIRLPQGVVAKSPSASPRPMRRRRAAGSSICGGVMLFFNKAEIGGSFRLDRCINEIELIQAGVWDRLQGKGDRI